MAGFAEAIQGVLTSGLDAAVKVAQARYQVNDPTPNTSSPSGMPARVGEGAGGPIAGAVAAVPVWAWAVGAVALAAVIYAVARR